MREAIAKKLQAVVDRPVNTEAKVVYVMCQTRKLLDAQKAKSQYRALRLYCHWALHVNLGGEDTTMDLLRRTDDIFRAKFDGPETAESITGEQRLFREFVYLETLRTEMQSFLTSQNVAARICKQEALWRQFMMHLSGVIEDGTLSCHNPNTASQLKWVQSMTFKKSQRMPNENMLLPFTLKWIVTCKPGTRFKEVEIEASADKRKRFVAFGYHPIT